MANVDVQSIVNFLSVFIKHDKGSTAFVDTIYDGMCWLWLNQCRHDDDLQTTPPNAAEFGTAMLWICNRMNIDRRFEGDRVALINVRYIGHPRCGSCNTGG